MRISWERRRKMRYALVHVQPMAAVHKHTAQCLITKYDEHSNWPSTNSYCKCSPVQAQRFNTSRCNVDTMESRWTLTHRPGLKFWQWWRCKLQFKEENKCAISQEQYQEVPIHQSTMTWPWRGYRARTEVSKGPDLILAKTQRERERASMNPSKRSFNSKQKTKFPQSEEI